MKKERLEEGGGGGVKDGERELERFEVEKEIDWCREEEVGRKPGRGGE